MKIFRIKKKTDRINIGDLLESPWWCCVRLTCLDCLTRFSSTSTIIDNNFLFFKQIFLCVACRLRRRTISRICLGSPDITKTTSYDDKVHILYYMIIICMKTRRRFGGPCMAIKKKKTPRFALQPNCEI